MKKIHWNTSENLRLSTYLINPDRTSLSITGHDVTFCFLNSVQPYNSSQSLSQQKYQSNWKQLTKLFLHTLLLNHTLFGAITLLFPKCEYYSMSYIPLVTNNGNAKRAPSWKALSEGTQKITKMENSQQNRMNASKCQKLHTNIHSMYKTLHSVCEKLTQYM